MSDPIANVRHILDDDGFYVAGGRAIDGFRAAIRSFILGKRLKAKGAVFGRDVRLRGSRYISIGDGFSAGCGLWLEAISKYEGVAHTPRISIGKRVALKNHVHISAIHEISIGNDVLIGSHVYIADCQHGSYSGPAQTGSDIPPALRALGDAKPTVIGDRVLIADGVAVMAGVTIGEGAIVEANAVVTQDVAANTIVAGVPARKVRWFNQASGCWQQS